MSSAPYPELRLKNTLDLRVWLKDDGNELLDAFTSEVCRRYLLAKLHAPIDSQQIMAYDLSRPIHFPVFETDFYPPDDYESKFCIPSDRFRVPDERVLEICRAIIRHNPSHGIGNVSQLSYPRLRKSRFERIWSVFVAQQYQNGKATALFHFAPLPTDKYLYTLLQFLKLMPVTTADIEIMPAYRQLITDPRFVGYEKGVGPQMFGQEFDRNVNRWRGFIKVRFKTGFFSESSEKFYFP